MVLAQSALASEQDRCIFARHNVDRVLNHAIDEKIHIGLMLTSVSILEASFTNTGHTRCAALGREHRGNNGDKLCEPSLVKGEGAVTWISRHHKTDSETSATFWSEDCMLPGAPQQRQCACFGRNMLLFSMERHLTRRIEQSQCWQNDRALQH